ncbi:MAG TPA: hypothetical protein VI341_05755 [Actinomycetota bacterium]
MDNQHEVDALKATVRELQERLDALSGLDERVRVAEARASDAERRLQELTDQVGATQVEPGQATDDRGITEGEDLRARLARTASQKKPGGRDPR